MTVFRHISVGLLALFVVSCAPNSKVTMGGVPGILFSDRNASATKPKRSTVPDAKLLPPEKRTKGQLRFAMPIEPNFKPSTHSKRKLMKMEPNQDAVPSAIESSMDRERKYRIRRLLQ